MCTVNNLLQRLEAVNVSELADSAVRLTAPQYLKLNKDQMWFGILKTGDLIAPPPPYPYPYSKKTNDHKIKLGQPIDRVTLFDTGDFYNQMKLEVNKGVINIFSTVPYAPDLEYRYSKDIFGLFSESRTIFVTQFYQQAFINLFKQATNL